MSRRDEHGAGWTGAINVLVELRGWESFELGLIGIAIWVERIIEVSGLDDGLSKSVD
jgi:hypothetical protein